MTGTKGKSTTAALITHLLTETGVRADLRGNIGTSLLDEPDPPSEVVVMELSSYQAQTLTVSPRIVVVTSLFPEHLTWHGSVEAYYRDKLNAVAHDPAVVVLPEDDEALETRVRRRLTPAARLLLADAGTVHVDGAGDLVWADGTRVPADRLPLAGRHQAVNTALACVVASLFGAEPASLARSLEGFAPLAHRMETVPSTDGRRWIDDSLATAPEAVVAALRSLGDQPVSVIVGGQDRGLDYTVLVEFLRAHPQVRPLLIGAVGARLADQVDGHVFPGFGAAAAWARSAENPDPVVLLSPGAPSYDEFRNYQERSAAFRAVAAGSP